MNSLNIQEKNDVDAFASSIGVKPCYSPLFSNADETKSYECKTVMLDMMLESSSATETSGVELVEVIRQNVLEEIKKGFDIEYFYQLEVIRISETLNRVKLRFA